VINGRPEEYAMRIVGAFVLTALIGLAGPACSADPAPAAAAYGEVRFANSGAAAAQAAFGRGMALLHDFEYGDAAAAFREAQGVDPGFAMAYWGEAMSYNHPVWMEQDLAKGREALARLGPDAKSRAAKAATPREQAYLHAVETLYGEGSKTERDMRYLDEMASLRQRWPDDVDAAAFHALALLGSAHDGRDVPTYMRAAAILEEALPAGPEHPGLLHYLIHAYDDPAHAPLGMRAARIYGKVAPQAGHAVHMTSHIFIALGMWDDVIAANQQAMTVVDAREASQGRPPLACGHYPEWLVYGYLQEQRMAEARAAIAACGRQVAADLARKSPAQTGEGPRYAVGSYASMLAREALETRRAVDPSTLPPAAATPPGAVLRMAYADALAAYSGGDAVALAGSSRRMRELKVEGTDAQVLAGQVAALELMTAGKRDAGLAKLRETVALETATPFEFGPPSVPKPTAELLGDILLAAGNPAEAATAYEVALTRAPGRTASLRGLLRAQQQGGDVQGASLTQARIAKYVRGQ
jgi:hypothetical protein